jgi:hypothetical protein
MKRNGLVSHWREFAYMIHEIQRIVLPVRPLIKVFEHWGTIACGLMSKPRKRTIQLTQYFSTTS